MSQEKTLITHARTGAARFLGHEITVQHANSRRTANGVVGLRVPKDVVKAKRAPCLKLGKPEKRSRMANHDDHAIVATYGAEYRGLVNYYLLAGDVWRLDRLRWAAETSLLKTLACKHDSTVTKMAARHKAVIQTPHGPRTCFQAVVERTGKKPLTATFGGIPLKRQRKAVLDDRLPPPGIVIGRKELIQRLQAGRCEMCQQTGEVEAHQVGKLAHLGKPGTPRPAWAELMARKRRKTLVVCANCHDSIHRQPTATPNTEQSPESWMIGNDHVRFGRGSSGKGPATLAPRPTTYLAL
jgi:Type II intron maturase/AI2M/AI1M-like, HNH endonuclease